MIKFKTFFGNSYTTALVTTADEKVNAWLEKHPNVHICDMQYQQAQYGDHSICIMYEDNSEDFKTLQQEQLDMAIALMRKYSMSGNEKEE